MKTRTSEMMSTAIRMGTTPDALLGVKREPEDLETPTVRSKLIDRMVSAVNNLADYELEIAVLQVEVILKLQNEKEAAAKTTDGKAEA